MRWASESWSALGVGWLARIALARMSSAPAGLTLVGSFAAAALAFGAAGSLEVRDSWPCTSPRWWSATRGCAIVMS